LFTYSNIIGVKKKLVGELPELLDEIIVQFTLFVPVVAAVKN